MKKKILIMYATYGTGHRSIANYVEDYFSKSGNYEIMKLDILDFSSWPFGKFTDKFYNTVISKVPILWDIIYRTTDNKIVGVPTAKLQAQVVSNKKIKKVIKEFNPDLVIATHFTAATYISKLKKNGEIHAHLISVVTDYKAHQLWLDAYKSEDALVVNSIEEKRALVKKGISPKIIKTFGIPVSTQYTAKLYDKVELMKKFKYDGTKPIILFYGGGGNGNTASLPYLLTLIQTKIDAEVIFVCGKNQTLKEKAEAMVRRYGCNKIKVLGFITNGPEYMTVADFVITKPGGITVTECLCFKKPMVLIKSTGGQEKDNYRFLTKKGYAINATWILVFRHALKVLCSNNGVLENMNKNLDKINKEESMQKLYDLVGDILDEHKS